MLSRQMQPGLLAPSVALALRAASAFAFAILQMQSACAGMTKI